MALCERSFPLPPAVHTALGVLEANGETGYLVGGSVRDALMGKAPSDFDLAVSCPPEATLRLFKDFRTVPTGVRHGTVTVVIDGMPLELTTFRRDGAYEDHRRPSAVTFARRIGDDLARRDFTVNAMAYRPDTGVTDPFGGEKDLKARLIRAVGEPERRFREDALRILRALRFASVLGFAVEPATAAAAIENRALLRFVSAERIFAELKKLLTGKNAAPVLTSFRPVLETVLPPLAAYGTEAYEAACRAAGRCKTAEAAFAALLLRAGNETAEKLCRSLKTDNRFRETVCFLIAHTPFAGTKGAALRLAGAYGREGLASLRAFQRAAGLPENEALAAAAKSRRGCRRVSDLALGGKELAAMGYTGAALGEAQRFLLTEVTEGRCRNTPSALRKRLRLQTDD